ncbi:UNVERIFIED_CONTAM: hypothetical protein Slati_4245500 [Sesamum latifolium]|uniref:Reverse transcriptase zinc-binding domain-containing protein n=1 Tax=Sesamum latifolium TaxID=2727402 RepID=A0AAW2TB68_9LAMI
MAFILLKHVIKEIEKRLRTFLWKGNTAVGYAKVSWQQVCRPISEGGLGIRNIQALNKGLMSRHLWRIIMANRSSIWVDWIFHYRLRDYSIWTISDRSGTWGWRKLIRLRDSLRPFLHYQVGTGPKVGWSSLLVGTFKVPRYRFILWLAILGRSSTLDKPWVHQLGTACVLCQDALPESHEHLFFTCSFATECLHTIRREVFFHWPYYHWPAVIHWASVRWRGKHVVNASFRALLALLVYHLWQERNRRIFQHITRSPVDIARTVVSDIRDLIICKHLPRSVSTRGLYRLWRIPWHVEGDAVT